MAARWVAGAARGFLAAHRTACSPESGQPPLAHHSGIWFWRNENAHRATCWCPKTENCQDLTDPNVFSSWPLESRRSLVGSDRGTVQSCHIARRNPKSPARSRETLQVARPAAINSPRSAAWTWPPDQPCPDSKTANRKRSRKSSFWLCDRGSAVGDSDTRRGSKPLTESLRLVASGCR